MTHGLEDSLAAFERFDSDVRARMQALTSDIEREAARILELLSRLEQATGAASGRAYVPPARYAPMGGDVLSSALESAVARASYSIIRSGELNPASVVRAGASVLGSAIGQSVARDMRLSTAQAARAVAGDLSRGRRNS